MPKDTEALVRRELISNAGLQLGKVVDNTVHSVSIQKEKSNSTIEKIYQLNQSVDAIQEATHRIESTSKSLEARSNESVSDVLTANEKMKDLERRFEPILKSIEVIDSIADNTKLLAVNASIQAAKAGQAGLSFAVVAKEIQDLSQSTQKTNEGISQSIDELRESIMGLSTSLSKIAESLSVVQSDAVSNSNEVNGVVDTCLQLNHHMSETHAESLAIKEATEDLSASFTEVDTIKSTFDAILSLMAEKSILSDRNDCMAPFEEIAAGTGFMDSDRFTSHEEEYTLTDSEILISSTDTRGVITYGNRTFYRIAQFEKDEMDNQPHNIIRHPDMPKSAFKHLWDTIQGGDTWQGIVLNKGKLGRVYWVRAIVFPVFEKGKIVGYLSVRSKPSREEIERAKVAYRKLP